MYEYIFIHTLEYEYDYVQYIHHSLQTLPLYLLCIVLYLYVTTDFFSPTTPPRREISNHEYIFQVNFFFGT